MSPKDMLTLDFGLPAAALNAFPKGEAYIQAGPVVPISDAMDAPWPRESTHKFRLLQDRRAVREWVFRAIRHAAEVPASGRAALLPIAGELFGGEGHGPALAGDSEPRAG